MSWRLLLSISALFSLMALPLSCRAWGVAGHAMIADIAEWHLTPAAHAEMQKILAEEGFEHLDQVGSWADEIRPQRKEASPWHYTDIPLTESHYKAERDCPKGDCSVEAIRRFRVILADKGKPALERREALKFLVHFIGDQQMPLHGTENAGDQGGNKVLVSYLGQSQGWGNRPLNLHAVWDSNILEHHLGVSEARGSDGNAALRAAATLCAAKLNDKITKDEVKASEADLDPVIWAEESRALAAQYVYPGVVAPGAQPPATPVVLGEDYDRRAWPVVQRRIVQGGLRLAAVLNQDLQ